MIEHDLAVLDAVSDYVCCLYGEAGAWGASTKIATVRNGINNFLAGVCRQPQPDRPVHALPGSRRGDGGAAARERAARERRR